MLKEKKRKRNPNKRFKIPGYQKEGRLKNEIRRTIKEELYREEKIDIIREEGLYNTLL